MQKNNYITVNIREYFSNSVSEVARELSLSDLLSGFSCPPNPNVEKFFKNNAVEFAKKNQSVTYFVFSKKDATLVGYFALAIKPITVNSAIISNTTKRKLLRIGKVDERSQEVHLAAYLIAQLGKNYKDDANEKITGAQLLEIAIDEVKELQYNIGGVAAFLEAENNPKLRHFYVEENHFKEFGIRKDDETLVQMLKLL